MNESQTTNQVTESQPDPDSQPPDLADQRLVAIPRSHVTVAPGHRAGLLSTNKAGITAFINKAEMRCIPGTELVFGWLCERAQCLSAQVWRP